MTHPPCRQTRSRSRQRDAVPDDDVAARLGHIEDSSIANPGAHEAEASLSHVRCLPECLTVSNTGLASRDLKLLFAKRERLREPDSQLRKFVDATVHRSKRRPSLGQLASSIRATFVFAQEEAGTAVCVSPLGLLLTCAHCVGESSEGAMGKSMWLIGAEGRIVKAQCTAWDERRDLAFMRVTAAEIPSPGVEVAWPYAHLASMVSKVGAELLCVGHPGSEDLEATTPGQATGYDVLHVSEGRYRGLASGQDVHDNSEIGALMHDCWTYWGHSGAPLIAVSSGGLIGLHSSWDDETGMRRGVALQAIHTFLCQIGATHILTAGDRMANNHLVGSRKMPILVE